MAKATWAVLGLVALLWPARLAGPVDGAPLDRPFEAIAVLGAAVLVWLRPGLLRARVTHGLILLLLCWKGVTALAVSQDGWCARFISPVALYRDTKYIPHTWDIRADWRVSPPQCSAVMTRGYGVLEEFPVWFFNLPPVDIGQPAQPTDRPPNSTLRIRLTGYLKPDQPGRFRLELGPHVTARAAIDDRAFSQDEVVNGIEVGDGIHRVTIEARLDQSQWALRPLWNDRNVWDHAVATVTTPTIVDEWVRWWGGYVPVLLMSSFLVFALASVFFRASSLPIIAFSASAAALMALLPLAGSPAVARMGSLVLAAATVMRVPRRAQNGFGASLLLGVPFLALFVSVGLSQIGVVTFYSSGDDWWMFQRYAYRIFMEGYWLEGGQVTFWFQPFYRWIAGSLHMIFGDSSVGELWWDAVCAALGAFFAFYVTRAVSGFRWGIVAGVVTLTIFTLGPAWYLFGRGLSELSSMGLIYGAAICTFRARSGDVVAALMAALLCGLAFYTRLNNLPMVCAVAVCAFAVRQPVVDVWKPSIWFRRASRPALAAVFGGTAAAMWFFTWRTWYYTGVPNLFYGTQAVDRAVVKLDDGVVAALQEVGSSVLMVLTVNDPPRFDVRSIPILAGVAAAILGVAGIGRFARLPLSASALALAGLSGAIVARGSAYPGRFSMHLIPATVAVFVCAVSYFVSPRRLPRSAPLVLPQQDTTSGQVNQSPLPG